MPHMPIDLGKKMDGPIAFDAPTTPSERKKYYPCLYLDWDDKYELPKSGEMTVRFRKKQEITREGERGTSQTVELDIESILDVTPDKESRKEKSGSDALDEYKKEVE